MTHREAEVTAVLMVTSVVQVRVNLISGLRACCGMTSYRAVVPMELKHVEATGAPSVTVERDQGSIARNTHDCQRERLIPK